MTYNYIILYIVVSECYSQGIRPEAFEKVSDPEIKEIIDGCTKNKTEER